MEDFNEQAVDLINQHAFDAAATLIEQALRTMPPGWRPIQDLPDEQLVACWDTAEFLCYTAHMAQTGSQRKIFWVPPSYSRSYYLLGMVYVERGQVHEALEALDQGLQLEPDHPQLMNEKAYIFQKAGRRTRFCSSSAPSRHGMIGRPITSGRAPSVAWALRWWILAGLTTLWLFLNRPSRSSPTTAWP